MPLSATVGGRSGVDGCFTSVPLLLGGPRLLRAAAGPLGEYLLEPDVGVPPWELPSADFSCDALSTFSRLLVLCFCVSMCAHETFFSVASGRHQPDMHGRTADHGDCIVFDQQRQSR